jgi:hypothetical protein
VVTDNRVKACSFLYILINVLAKEARGKNGIGFLFDRWDFLFYQNSNLSIGCLNFAIYEGGFFYSYYSRLFFNSVLLGYFFLCLLI